MNQDEYISTGSSLTRLKMLWNGQVNCWVLKKRKFNTPLFQTENQNLSTFSDCFIVLCFFVVWHKSCVNHRIVSIYPKTRCHPPMGCWGCHSYQCFTELPHWYCQIEFGSPKMWRVNRGFEDPKLVEVICGFFVRWFRLFKSWEPN